MKEKQIGKPDSEPTVPESVLEEVDSCGEEAARSAKYVVKYTGKSRVGRLHQIGVCRFSTDSRVGHFYPDLEQAEFGEHCKLCFPGLSGPVSPGLESTSESSSSPSGSA